MLCRYLKGFLPLLCTLLCYYSSATTGVVSPTVWGPGLEPHVITMPARYFFIQAAGSDNESISRDLEDLNVNFEGVSRLGKPCRVWSNILNRKDGYYIVRYKLYEPCSNMNIVIRHNNAHIAESPYVIPGVVYPDDCDCSIKTVEETLRTWKCGAMPKQMVRDLSRFPAVNWDQTRDKVIEKFDQPLSISLCHYVIKNNEIYRNCYGKYVGFKMFMDSILLSLTRKTLLPDLEFFVNLGDWPLMKRGSSEKFPIFSWCGSAENDDIIMPTYDITESTLENMGRVMLDMLSVQGNVQDNWEGRLPKAFWRGRDSNQQRLNLIDISKQHPDLFNVSMTNFFFFRDKQEEYGKSDHVSFFEFFNYKYQISIDGTVAAYRFPYLLAGGSLVFKQDSKYYEHFYNELVPNFHYIPVKRDLSDLVEKINWAIQHDGEARIIAENGQRFANQNLLPLQILCYYAQILSEFSKKITSPVRVLEGMEKVEQVKQQNYCDCKETIRDEL